MTEEDLRAYEKKRDEEQMKIMVKEMAISNAIKYISAKGSTPTEDVIEIAGRIYDFLTSKR